MTDQSKPAVDSIQPQQPAEPAVATDAAPAAEAAPANNVSKKGHRLGVAFLVLMSVPYLAFVVGCLFLATVLPDASGQNNWLIGPGTMACLGGLAFFVMVGLFGLLRILQKTTVNPMTKIMSIVRVTLFCLPAIIVAGIALMRINAEPMLPITIAAPTDPADFVAPLTVELDVQEAVKIIERYNKKAVSFSWDFNGDQVKDEDTVGPTVKAFYEKAGLYNIIAKIELADGTNRRLQTQLRIPDQVFSYSPNHPLVDQPVTFSVEHLVEEEEELKEVQWDFDNDGVIDETTTETDVTHIFFRDEGVTVTADVLLMSNRKLEFEKTITIHLPETPPFPVSIVAKPRFLVGSPPFLTEFSLKTDATVRDVQWEFGDGSRGNGDKVGHTFTKKGTFTIAASVRAENGDIANITKVVRIVDALRLPGLTFLGSPEVDLQKKRLEGEVPVNISLSPQTNESLVSYLWEAPEASEITSSGSTFEAAYRRPGSYTITMIAQDPEGRVLRLPLELTVLPPDSFVSLEMEPESGVAPQEVIFDATDTRIPGEEITGFEWKFTDEEDVEYIQGGAVMKYTYRTAGTNTISLKARTVQGNEYETTRTIVIRAPTIDACFTASRTEGKAPLGVAFDMSCSSGGINRVEWDFGDDTVTDERSPLHTFDIEGEYEVTLQVYNDTGSVSSETLLITAQ